MARLAKKVKAPPSNAAVVLPKVPNPKASTPENKSSARNRDAHFKFEQSYPAEVIWSMEAEKNAAGKEIARTKCTLKMGSFEISTWCEGCMVRWRDETPIAVDGAPPCIPFCDLCMERWQSLSKDLRIKLPVYPDIPACRLPTIDVKTTKLDGVPKHTLYNTGRCRIAFRVTSYQWTLFGMEVHSGIVEIGGEVDLVITRKEPDAPVKAAVFVLYMEIPPGTVNVYALWHAENASFLQVSAQLEAV